MTFRVLFSAAIFGSFSVIAQGPTKDPVLAWMNQIAQEELQVRAKEVAAVRTVADAERRKAIVRRRILDSIGGLPDYAGPLNAKITGAIRADGYVIEKIIYESLPGYFVTANLYRPDRPGRYPAVLLQAGHTQEGKAEPQWLAANLALKGFISLSFDPLGQGEREQTYDPQLKAPAAGWSTNEHIHQGAQAMLVGEGLARYFIWDAKRSIDYLLSRPDVDSTRLGAAGCSGGGALTTFIGGLDSRIKVVIPACFPNSYQLLFTGSDPHSEMTLPQHIVRGLDTADFVELSAPTPWLIQATEEDYFTPPGAKMMYEEAKRFYRLYGAEGKIAFFVGPGGHGTPLVSREAVYRWLIRWLNDGKGDYHDQQVKMYPNQDLLVTKSGNVEDEPGSRKYYQILLDQLQAKRKPGTAAALMAKLQELKIATDKSPPSVKVLSESAGDGFQQRQIRFESEPGIELNADLYIPNTSGRKPAVLLVAGKLSEELADTFAKKGRVVLLFNPRNSGLENNRRPFVGNWLINTRGDQIGRNMPSMRAHDILRGIDLLCAHDDVDASSIRAAGQGVKGIWLLLAAATDSRIKKIWLDKTPYSLTEALHNTLNAGLDDAVIPGFALHWDLEDLVKVMGDRQVMWTDPVNWMGKVVAKGSRFQYRWVLGDLTDMSALQDIAYGEQLINLR